MTCLQVTEHDAVARTKAEVEQIVSDVQQEMEARLLTTEAHYEEIIAAVELKSKQMCEESYTAKLATLEKAAAQRLEAAQEEARRQAALAADEACGFRKALEAQLAQAKEEAAEVAIACRSQIIEHSAKIQSE